MTGRVTALLLSNGLMLVLGIGLLPVIRLARTRRDLLAKLPLAYAVGLAATGVLAAELAVFDVPVGRVGLPLLAGSSLLVGLSRLDRVPGQPPFWRRPRPPSILELASFTILFVSIVFLVAAARLFAVKPVFESDGWLVWGTRARALFEVGHASGAVFTSSVYPALTYPLWMPGLEAVDFRFLGRFDATLANGQLFGLAVALVGGGWVLLRNYTPPLLLAGTLLAILTAPTFFNQLPTNFADVPLAVLMALGLAALAAWLGSGDAGLLPAAALFLGAVSLTKNEGEMFVLAAFVAAAVVAHREQLRPLAYAALAVIAIDLPWRVWIELHHIKSPVYSLSNLFSPGYLQAHTSRVRPSTDELIAQMLKTSSWSYLCLVILAGLIAAVVLARFRLALFGAIWLMLSFAALVSIYWISTTPLTNHLFNTADRTIDTLVIAGTLLVPVLLGASQEPRAPAIPEATSRRMSSRSRTTLAARASARRSPR